MSTCLHCAYCGAIPYLKRTVTIVEGIPTCSDCAGKKPEEWTAADQAVADAFNARRAARPPSGARR